MTLADWVPDTIDTNTASIARVYDYLLGGSHNFKVDRENAHRIIEAMPDVRMQARQNRAFLHRAVRFMVAGGIRQFLDIGSGIPTVGNVHEIAQQAAPKARVVYVDIDPVAVAHSEQILAGNDRATVIQADARRPASILGHPSTQAVLDFTEPVGLLMVALLHAVPDADDPDGIVAQLCAALVPGSFVAIGHATADSRPEEMDGVARASQRTTTPFTLRPRAEVERLFTGLELVEPGVVWAPQWRPDLTDELDEHPERASNLVGLGRVGGVV